MLTQIKNLSQIVTVNTNGKNYKSGSEMSRLDVLENHSIIIEDGIIKDFLKNTSKRKLQFDNVFDAKGKIALPGLIDCHTHTAFAGSRANEFREKLAGVDYEDIAKRGGGINATVSAIRKSSFDELFKIIEPRINYYISQGVTTLEIKSGYGLSYYDEIKLLQVIQYLNKNSAIEIIPTFLGAHTFPPEYKNDPEKYIKIICEEMIPFIAQNKLAVFCDAFCESTAFNVNQIDKIFSVAQKHGLKIKLHTDQFNNIGGIDLALKYNATSLDHLEVANKNEITKMSSTETVAVLLPGVSFFLDYDYAPARELIDNNVIVALSTDYNPGSSHISNLNLIMSLAALKMKMTIEETISAITINAAKALDISSETGSLEIGKNADIAIMNTNEYADIVYQVGKIINYATFKNGKLIYEKKA